VSSEDVDVVVIGLGAMGSAATYQLGKAGARVLGLDRLRPPHDRGSTHGDSRITRLGIGEGAAYVPLVRRSHELWRDIEEQTGEELLDQCGGLVMAGRDAQGLHGASEFLTQTVQSARACGVDHEILDTEEIGRRFPQLALCHEENGYLEPTAGLLRPERCVAAQLRLAQRHGADIGFDEPVRELVDDGASVTIVTSGRTVTAGQVIVAAGPWIGDLVPDLPVTFSVYRQVMYWFDLLDRDRYETFRTMPVYIWEFGGTGRDQFIYGFPMIDGPAGGAKVATEDFAQVISPHAERPPVSPDEIDRMYEVFVQPQLPALGRTCVKAVTCLYTVTPDHRFVIDRHPRHPNVIVASPCSGHGFKHSAAIGEVLAQLVTQGRTDLDISPFALPT
jgi:sarcosine oxidase